MWESIMITIGHNWQTAPDNGWHGEEPLGGNGRLILPMRNNVTGCLELFYTAPNGALYHNQQVSPGGSWAGETEILTSSDGVRQVAAGQNADGRWELLSTGVTGQLYRRSQTSLDGNWTDESAFPGDSASLLSVGRNADGRLELCYIGTDSNLYHRWQVPPGGNWTDETSFSGDRATSIVMGENADGRLELFYIGTNQNLYHRWQTSPNGGPSQNDWTGETPFPGDSATSVAVGENADGRLELFYIGTNQNLYHNWQTSANGGPNQGDWTGETPFSDGAALSLGVGRNADGRLELFYIGIDQRLHHRWQASPNGGPSRNDWTDQVLFSGFSGPPLVPMLVQNGDGRLEMFYDL
jgi:hypothetical protein